MAALALQTLLLIAFFNSSFCQIYRYDYLHTILNVKAQLSTGDIPNYSSIANIEEALSSRSDISVWQHAVHKLETTLNISPDDCFNQTRYLLNHPADHSTLLLLDSWAKPESGILKGNLNWLGNFNECINVTVTTNDTVLNDFSTRYCSVSFATQAPKNSRDGDPGISITLGVCVPYSCKASNVSQFFNSVIHLVDPQSNLSAYTSCQNTTSERMFGTAQTAALVFVCFMAGLCVLATVCDCISRVRHMLCSAISVNDETTPLISDNSELVHQEGKFSELVSVFSLYTNGKRLLSTQQPPGVIGCLNGIRFFSMCWVITGHTLIFYCVGKMKNKQYVFTLLDRWSFEPIMNSTLSVDSFFVLSGFLMAYLMVKDFHRKNIDIKGFFGALPLVYFQRYFRLTPALAYVLLFWGSLWYFLWDGPFWPNDPQNPQLFDKECPNNWYLNLLYVNNIFQTQHQCAGWTWYLANDFQFSIIAPFVILLFYRREVTGLIIAVLMVLGSTAAAFIVADEQKTDFTVPTGLVREDFQTETNVELQLYFMPWARYQSYGIGVIAGLIVWKLRKINYKIHKFVNVLLWGFSASVCLTVIYGPYDANTGGHLVHLIESDFYNGLARAAWATSLSYMITACSLGQGGYVDDILSWRGFVPLSKLTYSAYLIHIPIINLYAAGTRSTQVYTEVTLVQDLVFFIVLSLLVAFPFSLIYEVPFTSLDKFLLSKYSIKGNRQ